MHGSTMETTDNNSNAFYSGNANASQQGDPRATKRALAGPHEPGARRRLRRVGVSYSTPPAAVHVRGRKVVRIELAALCTVAKPRASAVTVASCA